MSNEILFEVAKEYDIHYNLANMEINSKTKGSNWVAIDTFFLSLFHAAQPKNIFETGKLIVILNQGGIQNRFSEEIKMKFLDILSQYLPEKATGRVVFHFSQGSLKQVNFDF